MASIDCVDLGAPPNDRLCGTCLLRPPCVRVLYSNFAPLQNLENSLVLKTLPHLLKPDLDLGLLNSQPRMEHVASGKNDLKHEQGSLCPVALAL